MLGLKGPCRGLVCLREGVGSGEVEQTAQPLLVRSDVCAIARSGRSSARLNARRSSRPPPTAAVTAAAPRRALFSLSSESSGTLIVRIERKVRGPKQMGIDQTASNGVRRLPTGHNQRQMRRAGRSGGSWIQSAAKGAVESRGNGGPVYALPGASQGPSRTQRHV